MERACWVWKRLPPPAPVAFTGLEEPVGVQQPSVAPDMFALLGCWAQEPSPSPGKEAPDIFAIHFHLEDTAGRDDPGPCGGPAAERTSLPHPPLV
jgi:hypothetical protein